MSKQFEELSNPVAEIKCHEDMTLSVVNVSDGFSLGRHPIYSQEYVTALLEALEEKDQRIAELEQRLQQQYKSRADEVVLLRSHKNNAPPAPAVPDELPPHENEGYGSEDDCYKSGKVDGWNACRAAMLNHVGGDNEKADHSEGKLDMVEPVSTAYTLVPNKIKDHKLNSGENSDDYYVGHQTGWNECIDAMIAAVPSPTKAVTNGND